MGREMNYTHPYRHRKALTKVVGASAGYTPLGYTPFLKELKAKGYNLGNAYFAHFNAPHSTA